MNILRCQVEKKQVLSEGNTLHVWAKSLRLFLVKLITADNTDFTANPIMHHQGLRHLGKAEASVEEVERYLEDAYCGHMSVETIQLSSLEEREWFADRFEELKKTRFSTEERKQLAQVMLESQVLSRLACPLCGHPPTTVGI